MESAETSSTVCTHPGPSATAKAKEIARLERWEAAEIDNCVKFLETTFGCTLADGKPCSTLIPLQYYVEYRAHISFSAENSWTWSFWEM